jgi:hypothetical protein
VDDRRHPVSETRWPKNEQELKGLLASPLDPGSVRVLTCLLCGALTYIRFGLGDIGTGDPIAHNKYHADRGERLDA